MATSLPAPLSAYFAAVNDHDIDAMLALFAEEAVVEDEGRLRRGRAAIRQWMDETTRKYGVTVEVLDVARTESETVVTGLVSGSFPGSPARLHYAFAIDGEKITHLEIG